MSGHVRKRQYQPSNQTTLNSFLTREATSRTPLSPPLDDATQSSLLSVGMRVRKSVPEGYKTHKTIGSQGFPFPNAASQPHPSATVTRPTVSRMSANSRELMPFCGLHKIGGLTSQPIPASSAPPILQSRGTTHTDDEVPDLYMSQSTSSSTKNSLYGRTMQTADTKKRSYEDEAESDMDAFFDEVDFDYEAVETARPKANLKTSRKPFTGAVHVIDGDDFEEATFLMPMDVE